MPELPEVETMRRGVLPLVGSTIERIQFHKSNRLKPIDVSPRPASFDRRAQGARITSIRRIGKRVVIDILQTGDPESKTDSIVFEPRMTGLVLIADPPNEEHLRVTIHLQPNRKKLLFWDRRGLGTARLYKSETLEKKLSESLGPDALKITMQQLRDTLRGSSRQVKVALLDQKAVAGIGNLYASEILFCAGVHPAKKCTRLTKKDWERVHHWTQHVLNEAIRYEGSTLGDGTYRNALNNPGSYQNHHRVYNRAGLPCPNCKTEVTRIVQAQRSTFFCKSCQSKR